MQNTNLALGTIHNHSNHKFCTRTWYRKGLRNPLIRNDSKLPATGPEEARRPQVSSAARRGGRGPRTAVWVLTGAAVALGPLCPVWGWPAPLLQSPLAQVSADLRWRASVPPRVGWGQQRQAPWSAGPGVQSHTRGALPWALELAAAKGQP